MEDAPTDPSPAGSLATLQTGLPRDTVDRGNGLSDEAMESIKEWYLAYRSLLTLCATVSVGVLVFSVTFVLQDALSIETAREAVEASLRTLEISWLFLLVSSVSVAMAMACNFKWYAAALAQNLSSHAAGQISDSLRFYTTPQSMRRWGMGSVAFGWVAGLTVVGGAILFVVAAILTVRQIYGVA